MGKLAWFVIGVYIGVLVGCSSVRAQQDDYRGEIFRPSKALAEWFESLDRPDYDAKTMGTIKSCCDAGDAYPIIILQEATPGGEEPDGVAEVTDTSARLIIKPNGDKKWRREWTSPKRFHFPGKLITREIEGNPTQTAWVFATDYTGTPMLYCVVPIPPGF